MKNKNFKIKLLHNKGNVVKIIIKLQNNLIFSSRKIDRKNALENLNRGVKGGKWHIHKYIATIELNDAELVEYAKMLERANKYGENALSESDFNKIFKGLATFMYKATMLIDTLAMPAPTKHDTNSDIN